MNDTLVQTVTLSTHGLAMLAFAGNSLLCRLALKDTGIDAASFTSIRLISAAVALWLLIRLNSKGHSGRDPLWISRRKRKRPKLFPRLR